MMKKVKQILLGNIEYVLNYLNGINEHSVYLKPIDVLSDSLETLNEFKPTQDLWTECVAMAKKMGTGFEIIFKYGFYFMSYPMFESDFLTLEELHAKLTELTKG